MTPVRFLLPAEFEMAEAAVYYESQAKGLGNVFLGTVERVIIEIRNNPRAWPAIRKDIRKRVVPRFPFSVLYSSDFEEIVIVAIMHQRRRPDYWLARI